MLFLYREVLARPLGDLGRLVRAPAPSRLPVVLTRGEVARVLGELRGVSWLIAVLLYGGWLRIGEAVSLRVKDLDLERGEIRIRRGKGQKDRVTVLPGAAIGPLREHLGLVWRLRRRDLAGGAGRVELPGALAAKYPRAAAEWPWQWVFPAARVYRDRVSGERCRHHRHPSAVQRAVASAVRRAGLSKRASCHTLRHSFAARPRRHAGGHWPDARGAVPSSHLRCGPGAGQRVLSHCVRPEPQGAACPASPTPEEAMSQSRFPEGWDAARVQRVLQHYEQQTDEEAVAEDEAAYEPPTHTAMEVPVDLVPTVRELIAKRRAS